MNKQKLKGILQSFKNKRILVVGDMMLDHYIWGSVERVSPEAPVPVVNASSEEYRLGGAANVVYNIKELGAEPFVVGICGNDKHGKIMKCLFEEKGISSLGLVENDRLTTVKSRIIAHNQQMLRVDYENRADIADSTEKLVIEKLEELVPCVDAVLIEDYNKGLLTVKVIETIINLANKYNKIVTVDPKFKNFFAYKNCTVFKPNLSELEKNMGVKIENEEHFFAISQKLKQQVKAKHLIVTRGEKGLVVFNNENHIQIPTYAKEVFDVSGAGDTVISTLTLSLACGIDIEKSAEIANHAAGRVCAKVGIHPASVDDIMDSYIFHNE